MLSVYYHSLGRSFEIRGAPSVMLPQPATPVSLGEALKMLEPWPDRVRDAAWRIVRASPPPRKPDDCGAARYPAALRSAVDRVNEGRREEGFSQVDLGAFDRLRREYRTSAHLFAAALVACAEGDWEQFEQVLRLLRSQRDAQPDAMTALDTVTENAIGQTMLVFLDSLRGGRPDDEVQTEIAKLEDDVGLNLHDFVEGFTDALAFEECWPLDAQPVVYPASSVIRQDGETLTTTATVTTLITTDDFGTLCRSIDPQCWSLASDVMRCTHYVEDPYTVKPCPVRQAGSQLEAPELLVETCDLTWGADGGRSSFTQVLRIEQFSIRDGESIELRFSLSRSVNSTVLWDQRDGGLLVDQGYIKARKISPGHWRVTSRKALNFSDRTPNMAAIAGFDVGQMLNYLAPAAMIWWVESEMYSTACDIYSNAEDVQQALEKAYAAEENDDG